MSPCTIFFGTPCRLKKIKPKKKNQNMLSVSTIISLMTWANESGVTVLQDEPVDQDSGQLHNDARPGHIYLR